MKSKILLLFVIGILFMSFVSVVGFSSVNMICAEGKLEGDTINLDDLYTKLNGSVDNLKRGPDYVEFYYTPTYNYGPFDRVRHKCGPFRVRVYYDNTIQLCSLAKMDTTHSLSSGGCSAALLLYPNMNGDWNAISDKTYLQERLNDIAREILNNIAGYDVTLGNSYITGFGDKYLSLISMRGFDWSFGLRCDLKGYNYVFRVATSAHNENRGPYYELYVDKNKIYSGSENNWNDASLSVGYIPKNHNYITIKNHGTKWCHCCCCDCPSYSYLYLGSFLFESNKGFLGNCSVTDPGLSWDKFDYFASGYGTGRAVKRVSSEMIVPGQSINVTLYIDPPTAKYLKIKDYIPKEFGFNGKVKIERRKLGNPNLVNTTMITVTTTDDGNYKTFELNGQNYDILKNLAWNEYIEVKYTLNIPNSLSQDTYTLKGADVTYEPQIS